MNKILLSIGAVLLMLSCGGAGKSLMEVKVQNPSDFDRENEIVEADLNDQILSVLGSGQSEIIVVDQHNKQIPYQLITNGEDTPSSIIFPVGIKASQTTSYNILSGKPENFSPMVYGRLVPERKDDFTWENNRIAYRIYGPALQETGEISGGLDIWVKSTDQMIIDKWYKDDLAGVKSYHQDHGEGLDFYKVGPTLGLGMTAPISDNQLWLGKNFTSAEILDIGPLRITMKFKYAPFEVEDHEVTETRIISLDAYDYLNKVVNIFDSDASELELATGLVTSGDGTEPTWSDSENGIIVYEVPADAKNGTIFTGAINPQGYNEIKNDMNHFMGINYYKPGTEYVYYTGGGWSKSEFINGLDQWIDYLKIQKEKIDHPLIVNIK